jgi:hypothetical protein
VTYTPLGQFGPICDPLATVVVQSGPPGSVNNPEGAQVEQIGIPVSTIRDLTEGKYSPIRVIDASYMGPICDPDFFGNAGRVRGDFVVRDDDDDREPWGPMFPTPGLVDVDDFIITIIDGMICKYNYETQEYYDCKAQYINFVDGSPVELPDPNCVGDDCYKFVDRLADKYKRKFIPDPYQGPEFDEFYCLGFWPDENFDNNISELSEVIQSANAGIGTNESNERLTSSKTLYKSYYAGIGHDAPNPWNSWITAKAVSPSPYIAGTKTWPWQMLVYVTNVGTHTVEYGMDDGGTFTFSGAEGTNVPVFDAGNNMRTAPATASITFTEAGWKRFEFTVSNGPASTSWRANPVGMGCVISGIGFDLVDYAQNNGNGPIYGKDAYSEMVWTRGKNSEMELEVAHRTLFAGIRQPGAPQNSADGPIYTSFSLEGGALQVVIGSRFGGGGDTRANQFDLNDAKMWIQSINFISKPPGWIGFKSYVLELPSGLGFDGNLSKAQLSSSGTGAWIQQLFDSNQLSFSMLPQNSRGGYDPITYGTIMLNVFETFGTTQAQKYVVANKTEPETFAVDHPAWSTWANNYMVWVNNKECVLPDEEQDIRYNINFPVSGNYVFEVSSDNRTTIEIDGEMILNGNNVIRVFNDFASAPTIFTHAVTSGVRTMTVRCTNVDNGFYDWDRNPGGWGIRISSTGQEAPIAAGGAAEAVWDSNANLVVSGSQNVSITLEMEWDDNPATAGTAIDSLSIGGKTWNANGRSGKKTKTISVSAPVTETLTIGGGDGYGGYVVQNNNKKLCFFDLDGNDCNAEFKITQVSGQVQSTGGIPDMFQIENRENEYVGVQIGEFVENKDGSAFGFTSNGQVITQDFTMGGGSGSGMVLNITIQAIQDGSSDYDTRLRINNVVSGGTGYAAGDTLSIPGYPYSPNPIKLGTVTTTIDNSAGEIFNTRQGIGVYLYKEGAQVTANDPIPGVNTIVFNTGETLEVVHRPTGYANSGCSSYTDSTSTSGIQYVKIPDNNGCRLVHLGGSQGGSCGSFRVRVIVDGTEIINSYRSNWSVADSSLDADINPQSSIQFFVEEGNAANAGEDTTTKFEIVSDTSQQRVKLITCRFEPRL